MTLYRPTERIQPAALESALFRTPLDYYVFWTGHVIVGRAGSLRSRALNCLHEVGTPVSLRQLVQRAARIDGEFGLDPDTVRNAVWAHQLRRPAAYLLLQRTAAGDFLAVTDIPFPAGAATGFKRGDAVCLRSLRVAA